MGKKKKNRRKIGKKKKDARVRANTLVVHFKLRGNGLALFGVHEPV